MRLTPEELAMERGDKGPGVKRCMDMLIRFGEAMGATGLMPIVTAHTMPKEPPELLRELTESATETGVPTTLHPLMSAFSPVSCERMGLPDEYVKQEMAEHVQRSAIHKNLGFLQTYCCLPMLVGNLPLKGQAVSWIGSGAQLMANSVLGARCNRDGTVINIAAAMTGRVPKYGMMLDENRLAKVIVRFDDVEPGDLSVAQLGAVGYHVGALAGSRNVVFDGIPRDTELDRLKYLMAPLAVSGAVLLCHVVGVTPEAPSLEAATGGREPELEILVTARDIRATLDMFAVDEPVDLALFGCPHCTIMEINVLASLLQGKTLTTGKRLWIGTGHQIYRLAEVMGSAKTVEKAGGAFASSCMATIPDSPLPEDVRVVATTSFKAAHYIPRLTKGRVRATILDMDGCIDAVTGEPPSGGQAE